MAGVAMPAAARSVLQLLGRRLLRRRPARLTFTRCSLGRATRLRLAPPQIGAQRGGPARVPFVLAFHESRYRFVITP